jgi:hypothetical protein
MEVEGLKLRQEVDALSVQLDHAQHPDECRDIADQAYDLHQRAFTHRMRAERELGRLERLLKDGSAPPIEPTADVMVEGARLAAAVMDCSGLRAAAKEHADRICEAVDRFRNSGLALRDLPEETRRDIKRWSRWARHREQYEAVIFNALYDATLGIGEEDNADEGGEP